MRVSGRRQRCHGRRADARARRQQGVSLADVAAGPPDVRPGGRRRPDADACRAARPRPARASVSSTGTTASAPAGSIAPVRIRTAPPGATARARSVPGRDLAADRRGVTGASAVAPATSALRTAKPSIALLSQGGSVSRATVSSASTRPRASESASRSGRSGRTSRRMRSRASSRLMSRSSGIAPSQPSGLRPGAPGRRSGAALGTRAGRLDRLRPRQPGADADDQHERCRRRPPRSARRRRDRAARAAAWPGRRTSCRPGRRPGGRA